MALGVVLHLASATEHRVHGICCCDAACHFLINIAIILYGRIATSLVMSLVVLLCSQERVYSVT